MRTYYILTISLEAQDKSINKTNKMFHLHGGCVLFRVCQQEPNMITT